MRKVGPERPRSGSTLIAGRYTGTDPWLRGHTALMSIVPPDDPRKSGWFVQVDNMLSEYSHGWWWFQASDWREL
jgi:hypothetical protein